MQSKVFERVNAYLKKRKQLMREERTLSKLHRYEWKLNRMYNARVFKPSEKDTEDVIKVCTEVREALLSTATDLHQESEYLKEIHFDSISSCYHFINKVIEVLIKKRSKCPWYMSPVIAETMTFGEMLILILIMYGCYLTIIYMK